MLPTFDALAERYDTEFTQTIVGAAQRRQVWNLLKSNALQNNKLRLLELNCGTGEDALWLAQQGHDVLATDISGEMVRIATQKSDFQLVKNNISFSQLGIQQIGELKNQAPFDLIFSNFGGLNCLSPEEIQTFLHQAYELLTPSGRLVLVVMPTICIWETAYFLWKRDWKNAFRRVNSPAIAWLDGVPQEVYYFSPKFFRQQAKNLFRVERVAPVGCCVPPSYLNHFFENKSMIMSYLEKADAQFAGWPWTGNFSDHTYLQLKRI